MNYSFHPDIIVLNPDDLYNYYSQEEIFKLVFNEYPDFDKKYISPFRDDENPNCYFIKRDNLIYFVDWIVETVDAIGAIALKYNLDLNSAIEFVKYSLKHNIIKSDYISTNKFTKKVKSPTLIIPKTRSWENRDISYWTNRYGITIDQLKEDKVFPISSYVMRKDGIWKSYCVFDRGYAITSNDQVKIYRPFGNKDTNKWLSNIGKNTILGKHVNYNKIIITKSYKDYRVIYNITGDSVIWLQNEGVIPDHLNSFLSPYKEVIIFYDNDKAGKWASNKLANVVHNPHKLVYTPEKHIKDISDMYCYKGKQKTETWLKNILNAGENFSKKNFIEKTKPNKNFNTIS